jgi:putative membrane protein insertion efficiency factor
MTLRPWTWPGRLGVAGCIGLIRVYQWTLGPLLYRLGPVCRFTPSCSQYTVEALRKYGLVRGLAKGAWRILRCNPLHPGGEDPP